MSNATTFNRFVMWNTRVCDNLTPEIEKRTHPYPQFDAQVADYINSHRGITLLDIGAGRHSDYSDRVMPDPTRHVIGMDISASELEMNDFLDERIAADACAPMPQLEGKVDLLVSKATMEHLPNNEAFLRNAAKMMKPDGAMILVFTNRYAPFAFINRMLPAKVSAWLLAKLAPTWAGQVGFEAHYDRTHYTAFSKLLAEAGFKNVHIQTGYFSSAYFRFFVPLYLVSLGFDRLRHLLQIENTGSYYLVTAKLN